MNCYLEKFTSKHVTQTYVDWLNNPNLMRYSEQRHHHHDLKSCMGYFESFNGTPNLLFAVVDADCHKHVGNVNAYIDPFNQIADIGILIANGGKGYGLASWRMMLETLFSEPFNIRKITAGAMSENGPMLRIFAKSGMSHEYTKLRHFLHEGRYVDMEVYFKERL